MNGFAVLLGKELLEQWRTRRLPIVAAVFVTFGIASPILARYLPEIVRSLGGTQLAIQVPTPTAADAVDQFLKNLGQAGVLTAILLAMGSVANEKERGTAALLLTTPASRAAFLTAKVGAIWATLLVSLALASAAAYAYTALLFSPPGVPGWVAMSLLLFLSLLAYTGLTFLGSTLTRSALAAAGLGVSGLVGLALVSALPNVSRYTPGGLPDIGSALATGADAGDVIGPVLVNAALVFALAGASWLVFRRQEL
ncbi:MAG TPA: ABC transporter permease [Candidatus Limnocylindria bacterium]|jgi:ABC-2 type transport system permease protein|nr:ABC transporter permease [Candidatus Limnocylindria bacterium]